MSSELKFSVMREVIFDSNLILNSFSKIDPKTIKILNPDHWLFQEFRLLSTIDFLITKPQE